MRSEARRIPAEQFQARRTRPGHASTRASTARSKHVARRQPEVILQGLVKGQGKEAKLRRKLEAGKERNWLLALTVNAFEKLADGAPLTDLDTGLLDGYRRNGYSDDQLKSQGRLFKQLPAETRRAIFPGKFAELTPRTRYTLSDLQADAPAIAESV